MRFALFAAVAAGLLLGRPVVLLADTSSATLINLETDGSPLTDALKEGQFDLVAGDPKTTSFSTKLIIWESKGRPLSNDAIKAIGDFVQQGGSLLMGFDLHPGLAPIQLNFLSPSTNWGTQSFSPGRGDTGAEIALGEGDPEWFPGNQVPQVVLPYHFMIKPFYAVERSMARYDILQRENSYTKTDHKPGDYFWTRPLLDRDWKVRVAGSDRAKSPLLLTGQYGAGRVAIFGSALDTNDAALKDMWKPVLTWLAGATPPDPAEPSGTMAEFDTSVIAPTPGHELETGGLRVTVKSSADHPLNLQVIGRVLTWEGAPVEDIVMPVTVPAGGTASTDLTMPATDATQYQALQWRRAFVVRVGLLTQSGATLLQEKAAPVDLSPDSGVELFTDNLYKVTYPYPDAPGLNQPTVLNQRMGSPVGLHAYVPGQTVNATVVLTNGLHNLVALATAKDETTPDNVSTEALTDGASIAEVKPRGKTEAEGCWVGKAGVDNTISFHFDSPVTLAGVALNGNPADYRLYASHNPAAVSIECDGHSVAEAKDLDSQFVDQNGSVHMMFDPVQANDVRVTFPWTDALPNGKKRQEPWLGSFELLGAAGSLPPAIQGDATVLLRDSMTGEETVEAKKSVSLAPGERQAWSESFAVPEGSGHFYQLEARFNGQKTDVPLMAIQPKRTLISLDELKPANTPSLGFIVTRGFRNCFPLGTGTQEVPNAWENPDDLVWCYSRRAKQVGVHARTRADWLYLSESDLAHYSDPWIVFPNGQSIWAEATPNLLKLIKKDPKWAGSTKAAFFFSDRWDTGPSAGSQYEWQELVAFDEYLRGKGQPGLSGKTRAELCDEVTRKYEGQWAAWQEANYRDSVVGLRDAFAAEGKQLLISGQGIPFTSNATAAKIADTICGMSDDNTWGMEEESIPWTTARQSVTLGYNPEWKMNSNFVWGWNSSVVQSRDWYAVPATTEPSRRHYYDNAWRGIIGLDGQYQSALTYGFGQNGMPGWVTSANDWEQMWQILQRAALIYPEAPLGAGFVVSSSVIDSPDSAFFSGGGMGGAPDVDQLVFRGTKALGQLHDSGLSLPFTANILALRQWNGNSPLILLDLAEVSDEEVKVLQTLVGRGVKIAAFAGATPLSPEAAALFGVNRDGTTAGATAAGTVAGTTLLAKGNCLYIPMTADSMTLPVARQVADILRPWLSIPITFPEGTMGYGFISGAQKYIVLEDWLEQGRIATLRVHADGAQAQAVDLNDHRALAVTRDEDDWLIQVPLRPGDGEVVVLQEKQ